MSKRFADLARAFITSLSRLRGGAFVTNESSKCCAACATSSTARLNAASFACDGFVNPQSFRRNCSEDARISSLVAGGSKLCRVLMFRHMTDHRQLPIYEQLFRDADVFWFGEESQCFFAAFAADAALFHAAEGDAQVAQQPAVHPNCPGVNPFCDAVGATQVLCPNARRQAVVAVIGVTYHFVFAVEWRDRDNRTKDFFAVRAA